MKVFIPDVLDDDDMAIEKWYPNDHEKEGMLAKIKEGKLEGLEELPELPVGGAAAPADGVVHPHAVVPAVKVEGEDEL